ncbi:MAG: ATPase, partial [Verrucomicrobiota bacterium]
MSFAAELELLIRARYPLLLIVTGEELRVDAMVRDLASRRNRRAYEWTCATGLVPLELGLQGRPAAKAATRDPQVAMDEVLAQVEPALFLFKDLHPFLTRQHPAVVRRLKDIALHLKNSRKTLLLVSPVAELPPELEKEVTVLPLPLPDRAELGGLLDRIVQELADARQVVVDLDETARHRLLQAAQGLTLNEAENVFAKIVVQDGRLDGSDVNAVFAEKRQRIRQSGLLEYCDHEEHFGRVGGLDTLKGWLSKRALAFTPE